MIAYFPRHAQSLQDNLAAIWSPGFTGNTGTVLLDSSGNGNHGSFINTEPASDWQQSNLPRTGSGTVIDYDSTFGVEDYADCGNKIILDDTGFSFVGWFNFNGTTSNWQTIISKHSGSSRQLWCGRNNNFGPPTNGFTFFSNNSGNGSIGSSSLTYNRWYFFALTHQGNTTTSNNLWVWSQEEGFLQTTRYGTTGGCDADAGTTTIKIGRMEASGANIYPANAKIADILCWKRVLSEGEVYTLRDIGPASYLRMPQRRSVSIAAGFKAYWHRRETQLIGGGLR